VTRNVARDWRRFWHEYDAPAWLLARFRFVFFALLALDAWLQIEHAPRYGAGDFNVSHVPWLDGVLPMPTRTGMLMVYVLQAYLALRIAAGAANRWMLIALTALFGYGYFISQLNSYQHHYLLFLLLLVGCFVPWRDTGGLRSWAVRLLLVQLSLLYFWAAMAKTGGAWLDGTTLSRQIAPEWGRQLVDRAGGFGFVAKLALATELSLAVAIQVRALKPIAFVVGVVMHVTVEALGFQIGMFSWFMVAVYLLVLDRRLPVWAFAAGIAGLIAVVELAYPAHVWQLSDPVVLLFWFAVGVHLLAMPARWSAALAPIADRARNAWRGAVDKLPDTARASWAALILAIGAGGAVVASIVLDRMVAVAIVAGVVAAAAAVRGVGNRQRFGHAAAHVAACAVLFAFYAWSNQAREHYKFWGGDLRRRGDIEQATAAYERVRDVDPSYAAGRYRLGDLYRRAGRTDDALAEYDASIALDAGEYRAHLGKALVYDATGRAAEAGDAARKGLTAIEAKLGEPMNTATRRAVEGDRRRLQAIANAAP
jgi:hypothetical protein